MTLTHAPSVTSAVAFQDGLLTEADYQRAYAVEAERQGAAPCSGSRARPLAEIYTAAELRAEIKDRNGQIASRRRSLRGKGAGDDQIIRFFQGRVRQLSDALTARLRADRIARENDERAAA